MWYIWGMLITGIVLISFVMFYSQLTGMRFISKDGQKVEDAAGWLIIACIVSLTWPVGVPGFTCALLGIKARRWLARRKERKQRLERERDEQRIPDLS